ncbi:MAG: enoyl-CoA hydratase/isomerase family protein [Halioglobus sp.]
MFDTLKTDTDGAVGTITLNRPERLNALSLQLAEDLILAADWFDQQAAIRVVVISGSGRAFCAGADLQGFPRPGEDGLREAADTGRRMADAIENMRAITIAQIHGWCVGGGLVLAANCDLRVAADSTRFSIPEIDLGIPLAWGGIPRLVREIGPALTKELVMTCREFGADEALAAGFLNRSVSEKELASSVAELASCVASKPATPIFATKRHTNAVTGQMVGIDRAWSDADSLVAALYDPDCAAAREAYLSSKLS